MVRRIVRGKHWLLWWPVFLFACSAQEAESDVESCSGRLVIAGGAVRADNAVLFDAFLKGVRQDPDSRVAVITAASASPVESANRIVETLSSYGVDPQRIDHVRLAVRDDASTAGVDESQWAGNAESAEEIAKVAAANAVWFAGGDQSRYTTTLIDDNGNATAMLEQLHARLSECATFGGTSAGAAIMSDPMITGGGTMGALLGAVAASDSDDYDEGDVMEPLSTGTGLGFFPSGIVDQHFGERARLGRLSVALERMPKERRLGFGIDENTALVADLGSGKLEVLGTGSVTVLDGRLASWFRIDDRPAVDNLRVTVLSPGDRLNITTGELKPAAYLSPTVGKEYSDHTPVSGGGLALPRGSLSDTIGSQLLDNAGADRADFLSFVIDEQKESTIAGVRYRFEQTDESAGYWGREPRGRERYSVQNVGFSIRPVRLRISTQTVDRPGSE